MCIFEQLGIVLNRAVDGRLEADWLNNSCTRTKNSNPPLLGVDLQGIYNITYVRILNRKDCCGKLI